MLVLHQNSASNEAGHTLSSTHSGRSHSDQPSRVNSCRDESCLREKNHWLSVGRVDHLDHRLCKLSACTTGQRLPNFRTQSALVRSCPRIRKAVGYANFGADGFRTTGVLIQGSRPPRAKPNPRHHPGSQAVQRARLCPGAGSGVAGLSASHRQTKGTAQQHERCAGFYRLVQRCQPSPSRTGKEQRLSPLSRLSRRTYRVPAGWLAQQSAIAGHRQPSRPASPDLQSSARYVRIRLSLPTLLANLAAMSIATRSTHPAPRDPKNQCGILANGPHHLRICA